MKPRTDKADPKHKPRNARTILDGAGRMLARFEHGRVSLYAQSRSLSLSEAREVAGWILALRQ